MMIKKKCSECKKIQSIEQFWKDCTAKDGIRYSCISCGKIRNKIYKSTHKETINANRRAYWHSNKSDPLFKLRHLLRTRVYKVISRPTKSGSAVRDLGCSPQELKNHLENQFQPGMTWENWSSIGWHIDHIKPLITFDLTDPIQFKEACHYTNLRPLWAKENLDRRKYYGKKAKS